MRTITEYEAKDGTRLSTVDECYAHDELCERIANAVAPLGEHEIKHDQFVQHDKETALQAKRDLVAIAKTLYRDSYPVFANEPDAIHPMSIAGRIIDDAGPKALRSAWYRLCCINFENFKEYEQPYFAINPDKFKP